MGDRENPLHEWQPAVRVGASMGYTEVEVHRLLLVGRRVSSQGAGGAHRFWNRSSSVVKPPAGVLLAERSSGAGATTSRPPAALTVRVPLPPHGASLAPILRGRDHEDRQHETMRNAQVIRFR